MLAFIIVVQSKMLFKNQFQRHLTRDARSAYKQIYITHYSDKPDQLAMQRENNRRMKGEGRRGKYKIIR